MHVKNTRPRLKKVDDRSLPMVFLNCETGGKVDLDYDPTLKHVLLGTMFDERM
jgi:hypothetical protein